MPDTFHPAIVARRGYNHGDIEAYREADLEGGPFRFSVGAGPQIHLDLDDDGVAMLTEQSADGDTSDVRARTQLQFPF